MTNGLNTTSAADESPQVDLAEVAQSSTSVGPLRWPADLVAAVSAALASVAVHSALGQHLSLEPAAAFAVAVIVFTSLVGLHIILRIEPAAQRVQPRGRVKVRKKRPTAPVDDIKAPVRPELPPLLQSEPPASVPAARTQVAKFDVGPVERERPATIGFDKLQVLVAELARTTPGPKAETPDPDMTALTTAMSASREFATTLERSHAAQAEALADAARIMHDAANPMRGGLAAQLADALAEDRLTVYLEPIQQMAQGRPRHYEISVRFRGADGQELPHAALLAAARHAGLLPRVDAAIVPRAARIAQHFQLRGRDTDILARVHAVSLPDQAFRAEVTAAAIAADGAAPVLSFAQSDVRSFGRIHWDILSTLADMGVRFAIESVTDLDMDLERLKRQGFSFAKLDKDVLLRGLPAPEGTIPTADVCRHFAAAGLALIVNHIDDEAAYARILGFGVLFGQGSLFGGPRAVRDDLLSRRAAASAA